MRTLTFDIGGTRLKAAVLDEAGEIVSGPVRTNTPKPGAPTAVIPALIGLARLLDAFDRVSIGFPGVVRAGVVHTAPNLGTVSWAGTDLVARIKDALGVPARLLNDASVQALGVIAGQGVEVVITLGTGMGFAMFRNGQLAPHLELSQHPVRSDKTYDQYVGTAALRDVGNKRWNKRVARTVGNLAALTSYDTLYIGGGNAKLLRLALPPNVKVVDNSAGLTGGIKLWNLAEDEFAA